MNRLSSFPACSFTAAPLCRAILPMPSILATALVLVTAPCGGQPLVWDLSFAPEIVHRAGRDVHVSVIPAVDTAYFITGSATHLGGQPIPGIARLGSDGAPDPAFQFGGQPLLPHDVVAPLSEGRFLVVHRAAPAEGTAGAVVRRYAATGAVDASFAEVAVTGGRVAGALRLSGGSIVVWGRFSAVDGRSRPGLARFSAAGVFDAEYAADLFEAGVHVLEAAAGPDGTLVVNAAHEATGLRFLARIDASGQRDTGFGPPPPTELGPLLLVQRDGRAIFGGAQPVRLEPDGAIDPGFSPLPRSDDWMVHRYLAEAVELENGEMVFDVVTSGDWSITHSLHRVSAAGVILGTWPGSGDLDGIAPDGSVITRVPGAFEPMDGLGPDPESWQRAPTFFVYAPDATRSVPLQADLGFPGSVAQVQRDDAGAVWISGEFTWVDGELRPGVAKLRADGTRDDTFDPPTDLGRLWLGVGEPEGHVWVYAREPSEAWWRRLRRLAPDGSLATAGTLESDLGRSRARVFGFDRDGRILAAMVDPDATGTMRLGRFEAATGTLVERLPVTFGGDFGLNQLWAPALLTDARVLDDGSILVAGAYHRVDEQPGLRLAKVRADGTADPDYLARIAQHGVFLVKALLHDGAALVAFFGPGGTPERVVRLGPDGDVDSAFHLEHDGPVPRAMIELADGSLVALGGALRRWRADGSRIETTNDAAGLSVRSIARTSDGDWVVGGDFGVLRLDALTALGIVIPPVAQSVADGETAVFSVEVGDAGPITFQWQRDGVDLVGETRSRLVLASVSAADAGVYRAVVRAGAATYVSGGATLSVRPSSAHLVNFSARSRVPAGGPPQIAGFITEGATARRVLLRGIGLEIPGSGYVRTRLMDPAIALYAGEHRIAEDARSARSPEMLALAAQVGAFVPHPWEVIPGIFINYDSALAVELGAGAFTLQTSSPTGASGLSLAEVYDAGAGSARGFVRNVSLRGRTGPGVDTLIGGFVVRGEGGLRLLVRVVGSELERFGVGNVLPNPRLRLYRGSTAIALNDDWDDRMADEFAELLEVSQAVGAFALKAGSGSAALVTQVLPGAYTVHAETDAGASGEVLLELYVIDAAD